MVNIGKYDNVDELKEIWRKCYDDPEEYIDFFMENMLNNIEEAVCVMDGKAVGVIYLITCEVSDTGEKAYYWYAGGVLPEYRNKGVFSDIVDGILDFTHNRGCKSFCYSMPELEKFYNSKGLTENYYKLNVVLKKSGRVDVNNIKRRELKKGEYGTLRNTYLSYVPHIVWDDTFLDYAVMEKRFCQGVGDLLQIGENTYGILGDIKGNILNIEETTFSYGEIKHMCDELCSMYNVEELHVQFPVGMKEAENISEKECVSIYTGLGDVGTQGVCVSLILL